MSDYRIKLIANFSRFWEIDPRNLDKPHRQIIPHLKDLMENLLDPAIVSQTFSDDAWARCFLLRSQHWFPNAVDAKYNQATTLIDQHLNAKRSESRLQAFFRKADATNCALLTAYLQQSAWYAAYKWCNKLGLGDNQESLGRAFTPAQLETYNPRKLLSGYNFTTYKVRTYAQSRLQGKVRGGLLTGDSEARLRKHSPQRRLKVITPKRLMEILQLAKVPEDQITDCCILHKLYREVYNPPKQERFGVCSAEPTDADWEAITDLFNQSTQNQSNHTSGKQQRQPIDAQQAKSMLMDTCLTAINSMLAATSPYQSTLSLDAPLDDSDAARSGTLGDLLASDVLSPVESLEQHENQRMMWDVIQTAFKRLPEMKQSAQLLMELGFKQKEITVLCNIPQSNISRIVDGPFTKELIKLLLSQHKDNPKFPDRTQLSQRLKEIDLSENISLYCQSVIDEVLENHWQLHNLVHQQLSDQVAVLSTALKQWLTDDLHVTKLDAVPDADQRITALIDSWLQAHYTHPAI